MKTSPRPFIFVADGMNEQIFSRLKENSQWTIFPQNKNKLEVLKAEAKNITALIVRSATQVNKELIDLMPNCNIVIRAGEGMDNIDLEYCRTKNIAAFNTPGANGNAAAELAVSHMLAMLRKIPQADLTMHQGKWEKTLFVGHELTNKKVGILGFGKIGQLVAKRLKGFDVEIFYFDPSNNAPELGTKCNTVAELFQKCSLISIHAPLVEQTRNLVTLKEIKLLPKPAWIVNCARGGIINETDLLTALNEGIIEGAALDVFEKEPLPENSPLRSHPKLVLTPHLGASTLEAELRVGGQVLNLLSDFYSKIP
ncbi:MAG: hydroxyacid dehydrogenase [Bacteriovoracaceae bacterium]|nr:hydroxyacid dehydrogenase [Bacteriovoracaceae bacterium]